MKKLLILFAFILVSCNVDKPIVGQIIGEDKLDDLTTLHKVLGAREGIIYVIEDTQGGEHFVITKNTSLDPLDEGDVGEFKLGEVVFSGNQSFYVDGKLTNKKREFRELKEFKLR